MKNMLNVKIQRKTYTLMTEESEDYTSALANSLDRRINECIKKNPSLSTVDSAFLTAFECLDELNKANSNIENIRTQIKDYVDDANASRKEVEKLTAQLEDAQKKISTLREKNASLHAEIKNLRSDRKNKANEDKEKRTETEKTAEEKNRTALPQQKTNFVGQVNYDPTLNGGQQ